MKRSVTLSGHRTSISLEQPFWDSLRDIAKAEDVNIAEIIQRIDNERLPEDNLSASVRIYVLDFYRKRVRELTLDDD